MTRSKLSDADKQAITQRFREPDQTIATLAQQYEVSSSTIRRLLKQKLSDPEYDEIVAIKSGKAAAPIQVSLAAEGLSPAPPTLKLKKKVTLKKDWVDEAQETSSEGTNLEGKNEQSTATEPELEELIAEIEHDFDDDGDLDDDDDDFDEDDLEDEDEDDSAESMALQATSAIEITPLLEAVIPNPCYLVIDRSAELIVRPLKEFGDLGRIPETESQSKTLPVFENHRIARRFSQRSQRVIKVPSGDLLHKTESHLSAKGITRLLINGRVYAL
ncbi:MAG: sigma factor-like helix-turn-helix DNA-binding protein [Thermosynechococcaceae cyanobacterium]